MAVASLNPAVPEAGSRYGRAIAFQLAAVAWFSTMGLTIKLLDGGYPLSEIILFRCLPALIPLFVLLPSLGGLPALRTVRPDLQAVRAIFGVGSMYCGFFALSHMAFADYVAISFTAPLFGTLLSIPLLGEAVGWRRMGAVMIGLVGALLAAGPVAGEANPMAALALLSALGYGVAMIAMRKLGAVDRPAATVFYFTVAGALSSLVLLPFEWVTPTPGDLALLIGLGLMGGIGQLFQTEAFRWAPPSIVAPFDYTALLWALVFGLFVFGTWPTPQVLLGAALICVSGLFIIHREAVRGVTRARIKGSSL